MNYSIYYYISTFSDCRIINLADQVLFEMNEFVNDFMNYKETVIVYVDDNDFVQYNHYYNSYIIILIIFVVWYYMSIEFLLNIYNYFNYFIDLSDFYEDIEHYIDLFLKLFVIIFNNFLVIEDMVEFHLLL